jgi:hypothetical protein
LRALGLPGVGFSRAIVYRVLGFESLVLKIDNGCSLEATEYDREECVAEKSDERRAEGPYFDFEKRAGGRKGKNKNRLRASGVFNLLKRGVRIPDRKTVREISFRQAFESNDQRLSDTAKKDH